MAELTSAQRNKLPGDKFALEKQRKYPVDTRGRAANAKARAQQQYDKGNLSKAELDKIDAKANKILGESAKGKEPMKAKKSSSKAKKSPAIVRGKKASSAKGFAQNIKRERDYGMKPKEAVAVAYGEADWGKDIAKARKILERVEQDKLKRDGEKRGTIRVRAVNSRAR